MSSEAVDDNSTLPELFDKAFRIYETIENSTLPTIDPEFQNKVKEAIRILEECTGYVNDLQLFSINETTDDVADYNLKYFLIPALLGTLTLKLTSHKRIDALQTGRIYFLDFMDRLSMYGFDGINTSSYDTEVCEEMNSSLLTMAKSRNEKIKLYNRQQELKLRVSELREIIKNTNPDSECVREYYFTLIRTWIATITSELESMKMETDLLSRFKNEPNDRMKLHKSEPLKPIIIKRNEIKKKVFGLGYPSAPTMSIEHFIDTKIAEGSLGVTNPLRENSMQKWAEDSSERRDADEDEAVRNEEATERDDMMKLQSARNFDDWKDENKRGSGNRYNKS